MDSEFITCDIDTFMRHYLPFVPDQTDVTSCVENILKPHSVMVNTQTPVFTAFHDTPVVDTTVVGRRTEMEIFAPLETIAKHISTFKFPGNSRKRNKFSYRNVPHSIINSNTESSGNKVDACFSEDNKVEHGDPRINTWGMAVPIVQKVDADDDREEFDERILSANVQIMYDDVRRKFMFGVTFDADQMTLWYHSRSHSAVSQSFSFVKDFQHDLESFWRLTLWIIISHIEDQSIEDWQGPFFEDAVEKCQEWAAKIFMPVNVLELPLARLKCFNSPSVITQTESFTPENVFPIIKRLELQKQTLLDAHRRRVKVGQVRDKESYAIIHLDMTNFFASIQRLQKQKWRAYTLNKSEEETPTVDAKYPIMSPGPGIQS